LSAPVAIVNRSVSWSGIGLVHLNEPEAKIEFTSHGEGAKIRRGFRFPGLECTEALRPPMRQKIA